MVVIPWYPFAVLKVNLADFSGGLWATCFGEHGEQLISATASQVGQLSEQEDYEEMDKIFKTPVFRNYLCTLRVKTDSFNVSKCYRQHMKYRQSIH